MFGKKNLNKGKQAVLLLFVLVLGAALGALIFYFVTFSNPEVLQNRLQTLALDQYLDKLVQQDRIDIEIGNSPIQGPTDAKVTMVEFTDLECPYCRNFANEAFKQLEKKYAGKVQFVFKHYPLPFHEHAMSAHQAAYCAQEQGKFWEMAESLFAGDISSPDTINAQAQTLGLDMTKFAQCLKDPATTQVIEADKAYGQSLGISGTPAFYVNGLQIVGALPVEVFEKVIDQELAN